MRIFIYKIFWFFLLVAIVDVVFGFTMRGITKRIDIGGVGRDNYICDKVTDGIIIFGSSRAEHHYNAQMITDSLGMSCYNCGEGGCGIILAYGRLQMLLERYKPNMIIYEVTPLFDFLDGNNYKYLSRLKQHYERPGIDSIFEDVDPTEKYKMISGMYRYNSSFLQNLVVYFLRMSIGTGVKGFRPINEEMDTMKIMGKDYIAYDSRRGYVHDPLKFKFLKKFMDKIEDVNVLFVISPIWYGQDTLVLDPIKKICEERKVQLIDFSNNPKYVHNNKYFSDGEHLNVRGADEFTKDLIIELRKRQTD